MKRLLSLFLVLALLLPVLAVAEEDDDSEIIDLSEDDYILDEDGNLILGDGWDDEDSRPRGSVELTDDMIDELTAALESEADYIAPVDPESMYLNPNLPDNVINIMLLGVDTREDDFTSDVEKASSIRADVQMILSLDRDDGSIKLSSILRDTLVQNPVTGKNIKIANSYQTTDSNGVKHNNPLRSVYIVNHNFEMNIQYYVSIDFYGVATIIESLGGIDLDMTAAEAWNINVYLAKKGSKYYKKAKDGTLFSHGDKIMKTYGKNFESVPDLEIKDGVQHLNGLQALIYARIRKTVSNKYKLDGDWGRTARTRKLLTALLDKVLHRDVTDIINIATDVMSYMETNMSASLISELVFTVLRSGIFSKLGDLDSLLDQFRIPMDRTWGYTDDGSDIFMSRNNGNFQKNIEGLHEFIYGDYYPAK